MKLNRAPMENFETNHQRATFKFDIINRIVCTIWFHDWIIWICTKGLYIFKFADRSSQQLPCIIWRTIIIGRAYVSQPSGISLAYLWYVSTTMIFMCNTDLSMCVAYSQRELTSPKGTWTNSSRGWTKMKTVKSISRKSDCKKTQEHDYAILHPISWIVVMFTSTTNIIKQGTQFRK